MTDANDAPQKPKRKWVPIAIGVALLIFVLGLGGVIFSVAWMRQHLLVTEMPEAKASEEFATVLTKFRGQRPLLELRNGQPVFDSGRRSEPASSVKLTTLRVLAWDDDEQKLATFELPFWLLRMKPGPIAFSSYASGFDDRGVNLRVEDVEKHGPGIVLDLARPGEGRVLIWAE